MEEPLKEKQHTRPPRQSRLREVQQMFDSDNGAPEMQLEPSTRLPDEEDDPADIAFLDRVQVKPSRDSKKASQLSSPLAQTFGVSKPPSYIILESSPIFGFEKRSTNQPPPPKADCPVSEHTVPAGIALRSIETAAVAKSERGMGAPLCISIV